MLPAANMAKHKFSGPSSHKHKFTKNTEKRKFLVPEVFCKKPVLNYVAKFTRKYLWWDLFEFFAVVFVWILQSFQTIQHLATATPVAMNKSLQVP